MSLDELIERFRRRDRAALSRLLTLAVKGDRTDQIREALETGGDSTSLPRTTHSRRARTQKHSRLTATIAVTGSGGVGKSTLVGKLIEVIRSRGQTVAVLACDPQSSITGGALLGDRVRMSTRPNDEGVFIRSLATPAGHSGVAPNIDLTARLLAAFGFDIVLIETVGAGQGDTAVRDVTDVVVVLVQPETGDDLQWEKAGQLEIADVVVVHKADLPNAERVESQLREQLNQPGRWPVPVVRVSSNRGQGLVELWQVIAEVSRGGRSVGEQEQG